MARTKQSAKRSTGGTAPKGELGTSTASTTVQKAADVIMREQDASPQAPSQPVGTTRARRARSSTGAALDQVKDAGKATRKKRAVAAKGGVKQRVPSSPPPPPPFNDGRDKFCYLCHNGGRCLVCSDCPRVVCSPHLAHEPIPAHEMSKLTFVCLSCHIRYVRGHRKEEKVEDRRGRQAKKADSKYMAFYRQDGADRVAHLPRAVQVTAPYHVGHHARVYTSSPVGIILFRLRTLPGEGSVPRVVYEAMKPYFVDEEVGNLVYREVVFDLNSDEDVAKHHAAIMEALAVFSSFEGGRILLFVYTHADEETGTLFFGANLAAQTLRNWFDVLIPEEARTILRAHSTTLFMLCCGALVAADAAYEELKAHCLSLRITRLLAFEAGAFQAAFATPFFLIYAYKFIIENANFDDHQLANVLSQSLYLGRHSKVIVMSSPDSWETLTVAEYIWSSRGSRPWGEVLPIQCVGCSALRTYDVVEKKGNYIATCTEDGCSSVLEFKKREGDVVLKGVEGNWLKRKRE